jgi:nitrogen regulatory protein P-II 1
MKMIVAVIRQERLDAVSKAMKENGFMALTTYEVRGRGEQGGIKLQHRGIAMDVDLIPKTRVEIVVTDDCEQRAIEIIQDAAWTGKPGDGRIFVLDVAKSIKVRTGEVA